MKAVTVFCILSIATISIISAIAFAMPDNTCSQIAHQKDEVVQKLTTEQFSDTGLNPCTEETETFTTYSNPKSGAQRIEYASGDATGILGFSNYVICEDGRAQLYHEPYGLASTNPLYICNTL